MTHSHDTATPALSVESEYVLVPREEWADAYKAFVGAFDTAIDRRKRTDEYAVDARIRLRELNDTVQAAAPAPNPSPAAKGGEAGEVVRLLEWEHHPLADGQVRAACPFGTYRIVFFGEYALWGIPSISKSLTNRDVSIEAAKAAAQADFEGRVKSCLAALATPSPQPAEAVREAMRPLAVTGEDADECRASRGPKWCKIFDTLRDYRMSNMAWEDGEPGYPLVDLMSRVGDTVTIADGEFEMVALADEISAALASDPAPAREVVEPEGPFIVMSSNYSRPFLLGYYETLERAVKAQCGSPEKWDIFTRHPAPEDTARLREENKALTLEVNELAAQSINDVMELRRTRRERDDARKALEIAARAGEFVCVRERFRKDGVLDWQIVSIRPEHITTLRSFGSGRKGKEAARAALATEASR